VRRLLRLLLAALVWLLILVLLVVAGAVALVVTEDGTRWLFAQAERHAAVEFQVDSVDGTLFRGLSLAGLRVQAGGTGIALDEARIHVDSASLLKLTLRIRDLSLAGVTLNLPEPDPEPAEPPKPAAPLELPETIDLPVRVVIERFSLTGLQVQQAGQPVFALDRLALRLEAGPDALQVGELELGIPGIEVWLDAELQPAGAYPLQIDGRWRFTLPEALAEGLKTTHAEGVLTAEGNLRGELRLRHRLQAGAELDTQLAAEDLFGTPRIHMDNHWTAFSYRLDPENLATIDAGELVLRGTLDDWTAGLATGAQLTGLPEATLAAELRGSMTRAEIVRLALNSDAGRLDIHGSAAWGEMLTWDLQAGLRDLSTRALGLEFDAAAHALQLSSAGSLPLPGEGGLEALLPAITAGLEIRELRALVEGQELQGSGRLRVQDATARLEDMLLRLGPEGVVRLDGEADLGAEIAFRLALAADALDLGFLVPDRELVLDLLRLDASGSLGLETGALAAEIALSEFTAVVDGQQLSAQAALGLMETQASIRSFEVFLPADGRLSASGRVAFGEATEWELEVSGQGIDPGVLLPELAGSLALQLEIRGAMPPDGELRAEVNLHELRGELRGQPVEGAAAVVVLGPRIQVDRLDLSMGANRLNASGGIGDVLDLALALDAPELDRILPALGGRIQLDANLDGTLENPRVRARGQGSGLRYEDFRLDSLSVVLDAGLDPEAPAELALRLSEIHAGGQRIDTVQVNLRGQASAHRLVVDVDAADLGRLRLEAAGGYDLEQTLWSGRLERLDLVQPLAGDWSLRRAVAISAGPDRASLGDLCLGRARGNICLAGDWDPASGSQGQASLQDLDLAWLEPLLPEGTTVEGILNLRLQASVDPAARLRAELTLDPAAGVIGFELADGTPQRIPYRDLRLAVRVDDRSVDADMGLSFLDDGEAIASVRLRPEGDSQRIDGVVRADLESLEWVGAFSPEIQKVYGRVYVNLVLGGLLDAPLLEGSVRLEEAGVTIPEAGLRLEVPLLLAEVVSAEEMRLSGEVQSGGESLLIDGELEFTEQGPRAEVRINGENFLAVDRPDIRARINPDLTVSFRPELLSVRGEILVPSALIRPPDLPPGSVTVSRDEVVVGEEADAAPGLPMDIRVRVILGDDVRFDGFDLEARFTGDLDLVDAPGRPLQIFGDVNVPEGRYRAWGQDLQLERGQVVFQGPVESPALDLRAVRRVRQYDVVVGVEIGGTPDELRSRVFSEPPMDDTEAMAYLLTGRPLSGASQSEGSLIAGAATAWGLEQSGLINQRLGSELGLDVGLDTESGLDQSALTIGTYLSPRLLMRYSVGLFDNSVRVMLRYELTRSLSVETTSSAEGQGVDLIFRIER
jgi:translocation and assembly module TamB